MLRVVDSMSRRMRLSSSEASSFIFPYLLRISSMRFIIFGNTATSSASLARAGYLASSPSSLSRFRKATIPLMVLSERLRSNISSSSRNVPSRRMRMSDWRTSMKFSSGKSSSSAMMARISEICDRRSPISSLSSRNSILSTHSMPSADRQRPLSIVRISLNPILLSKFSGYIISVVLTIV